MKQNKTYLAGLDIGSTTAKLVLADDTREMVFSRYQRHYARIMDTVSLFFQMRQHSWAAAGCTCL